MIKVDYEYYKTECNGTLTEDDFNRLVKLAYVTVDNFTFGRFSKLDEKNIDDMLLLKVKMCICELCDSINESSSSGGLGVGVGIKSSESVGSWSVNYAVDSLPKSVTSKLHSIVNFYLGGTCLMCSWI